MAQVYLPDDPRVRAQLEGAEAPAVKEQPRRRPRKPRRLGGIDLVVFLAFIAGATLIVLAAARWTTPLTPAVTIDLSPSVLPAYAGYSLLRMMLAYLLSLVFTLIYGRIAATNRSAEVVMVPLLDILQSIPFSHFCQLSPWRW